MIYIIIYIIIYIYILYYIYYIHYIYKYIIKTTSYSIQLLLMIFLDPSLWSTLAETDLGRALKFPLVQSKKWGYTPKWRKIRRCFMKFLGTLPESDSKRP